MAGIGTSDAGSISTTSRVLKPRFQVLVGPYDPGQKTIPEPPNVLAQYAKSAWIQRNNWNSEDRFKVVCALGQGQDYDFWGDLGNVTVSILLSYDGLTTDVGQDQVFWGIADKLELDCRRGEVTLTGRNLLGMLANRQSWNNNYKNTPASDIAQNLADPYGMTVDFGNTVPDGIFGTLSKGDKSQMSLGAQTGEIKDLDVMAKLANQLGRTLYERNGKIYLRDGGDYNVYNVQAPTRTYNDDGLVCHLGPSNSTELRFVHDYTQTGYGETIVVNHNFHGPEYTVHKRGEETDKSGWSPLLVFTKNREPEDADTLARGYHMNAQSSEWRVEWVTSGPEVLDMEVIDMIDVSGTNSGFDGPYQIESIEYAIHWERGMSCTVCGKWGKASGDNAQGGAG